MLGTVEATEPAAEDEGQNPSALNPGHLFGHGGPVCWGLVWLPKIQGLCLNPPTTRHGGRFALAPLYSALNILAQVLDSIFGKAAPLPALGPGQKAAHTRRPRPAPDAGWRKPSPRFPSAPAHLPVPGVNLYGNLNWGTSDTHNPTLAQTIAAANAQFAYEWRPIGPPANFFRGTSQGSASGGGFNTGDNATIIDTGSAGSDGFGPIGDPSGGGIIVPSPGSSLNAHPEELFFE